MRVILGHSNVGITMNLYVHVTEEEQKRDAKNRGCTKDCVVICVVIV